MYSIPAHCNVWLNNDHHVYFLVISRKETNQPPNGKQIQRQEEHPAQVGMTSRRTA